MSTEADPQKTLRDYFARNGGIKHTLIVNINQDQIEFYVKPDGSQESDGMHFRLNMQGRITEVGIWE